LAISIVTPDPIFAQPQGLFKRLWITLAANAVRSPTRSMKRSKRVSPIPHRDTAASSKLQQRTLKFPNWPKAGIAKVQQSIAREPQAIGRGLQHNLQHDFKFPNDWHSCGKHKVRGLDRRSFFGWG
jgi:hypothetical protein